MSRGPDIGELLGAIMSGKAKVHTMNLGDEDEDDDSRKFRVNVQKDAQLMELAAIGDRYIKGCPFEPGDIITPRPGFATNGVGNPHVVLDVRRNIEPVWNDKAEDHARQGRMMDIRVACYVRNDVIATFWVESYQYEAWKSE